MKTLTEHIKDKLIINQRFDDKLVIIPSQVDEKLVINKNYNYSGLDDIYEFEWNLNKYGIYCKDKDNLAINIFYEYFINSVQKKISFAQQCKYANDGEYLCASKKLSNGSHLMYLFHLNDIYDKTDLLYSKFVFVPVNNGFRISYNDFTPKEKVYSLSRKSHFSRDGLSPEYYLASENIWDKIKTVYKNLCNQ